MSTKRNIQVCFTTGQFENYADGSSTVVVVDVLRATSVISTAFECGVDAVIPVRSLEEALAYRDSENHIIAAERNTLPIEGFDFGNSPYHYLNTDVHAKILVLTTTNGTRAIHLAKAHKVITASFINIDAVANYLIKDDNNVIILCSGWKGFFNLEDTIFAGALSQKLLDNSNFLSNCDSLHAAVQLYSSAKKDLFGYLNESSYRKRNKSKEVIKDTHFCLNPDITSGIVPVFVEDRLIKLSS